MLVHCLFEQSGTFKNEFRKLGHEARDYDIQNNFNETDCVIDLFNEIDVAYEGRGSLFDTFSPDDLILAFYPCIYFCSKSQVAFFLDYINYRKLTKEQKIEQILLREERRDEFYRRLLKLVAVVLRKNLRLIIENPWTSSFLKDNFLKAPDVVDRNRMLRGDYYVKPTAYWFWNIEPTDGFTAQNDKEKKIIEKSKGSGKAGLCSEERSMISPDYARNFICDFILGKPQKGTQLSLF